VSVGDAGAMVVILTVMVGADGPSMARGAGQHKALRHKAMDGRPAPTMTGTGDGIFLTAPAAKVTAVRLG
jgi:hypothetical protein